MLEFGEECIVERIMRKNMIEVSNCYFFLYFYIVDKYEKKIEI